VGAEVFGQLADGSDQEDGASVVLAEHSAFRGTGVKIEGEAEVGYGEIKAAFRQKRWRQALPALLAMGGLSGLLAFGSLALLVRWQEKLLGALVVALVFYTLIRIGIEFARA
jgi:hypothetical protein